MTQDGEGVGFVFGECQRQNDGHVGVVGCDDGDGGSQDAGEEAGEGLGHGGGEVVDGVDDDYCFCGVLVLNEVNGTEKQILCEVLAVVEGSNLG